MKTILAHFHPRNAFIPVWVLVSVVFTGSGSAQTLDSITLNPADPTVDVGQLQSFTATGAFSDGSTRRLTSHTLSGGDDFTCSVLLDGSVRCWGKNDQGQLGRGFAGAESYIPVTVTGISTAIAVTTGRVHACALLEGGTVKCWGQGGLLGDGTSNSSSTPVSVSGIATAVDIRAGALHTCALLQDGSIQCWGVNDAGQLGDGTTDLSFIPVSVSGITTAVGIASGNLHSCAVLSDGTVRCWGDNEYAQLGNGTTTNSQTPVAVTGISTAIDVAAGAVHTCAVLATHTLKCWGYNDLGQLGDGTTNDAPTPVTVTGISTAVAVTGGEAHSCALLEDETVQCWGAGSLLGAGNNAVSSTAVPVTDILTATAVSAGTNHTCALLRGQTVTCWGEPFWGGLGNGYTNSAPTPIPVVKITIPKAVDVSFGHACAVLSDGTVQCWGYNSDGELGNGTGVQSLFPVSVSGISGLVNATSVAVGDQHLSCALIAPGTVRCWGWNEYGELGAGISNTHKFTPVSVSGISSAVDLAVGYDHACAVLANGGVKCWGRNNSGQLGDGSSTDSSTPVPVPGITTATAVAAGEAHTCALLSNGDVKCWGSNSVGQLGNGGTDDEPTPISIEYFLGGNHPVIAISASSNHTCVVLDGGEVVCWGSNAFGQLGNGKTDDSKNPVSVSGISTAIDIAVGDDHSCALLNDGTVQCWGDNTYGELGDGTNASSLTPVAVPGIVNATGLGAGGLSTCALLSGDTLKCWGINSFGQLGDGTTENSLLPIWVMGPGLPLAWTSGNPVAASINANGVAAALSPGTSTITATSTKVSGDTLMTVEVGSSFTLVVGKAGAGSGTVTSTLPGIDCGVDCSEVYPDGTSVTLTALPEADSSFAGWSGGGCSGTGTCTVSIASDIAVIAAFDQNPAGTFALTVTPAGTGNGTVTSSPAGIDCGQDCSEVYGASTVVALTGTAGPDDVFAGFSGDADCADGSVTMDAARNCVATFNHPLSSSGNLSPSIPDLIFPIDGQKDLGTIITFKWMLSFDPDDDPVTYMLCLRPSDSNFSDSDCEPVDTGNPSKSATNLLAGAGFWGAGTVIAGIVFMAGPIRRRRLLSTAGVILLAGTMLVSCGGTGGGGGSGGAGEGQVSVSGLQSGTTYYWKLIAEDDQGGESESEVWSFTTR